MRVHQVSVKKPGGYNLLSVDSFLALPSNERTKLILERKIEFLDAQGVVLPLLEAVRSINQARTPAR